LLSPSVLGLDGAQKGHIYREKIENKAGLSGKLLPLGARFV
jgi:hypothetical protein